MDGCEAGTLLIFDIMFWRGVANPQSGELHDFKYQICDLWRQVYTTLIFVNILIYFQTEDISNKCHVVSSFNMQEDNERLYAVDTFWLERIQFKKKIDTLAFANLF